MEEGRGSYDYDELRTAARTIKASHEPPASRDVIDAALLLAQYVDASLDLSDEVDGRTWP